MKKIDVKEDQKHSKFLIKAVILQIVLILGLLKTLTERCLRRAPMSALDRKQTLRISHPLAALTAVYEFMNGAANGALS